MEKNNLLQAANANLTLFNGNAEQWTIALDKTREANEKGIPVSVHDVLENDNNEIIGLSANGLTPSLQKVLAENPLRVTTYRDQLPQLDAFARSAEWAAMGTEDRLKAIRDLYSVQGVPVQKQREIDAKGIRPVSGGKFETPSGESVNPATYLDACGPEEKEITKRALEAFRKAGFDPENLENFGTLPEEKQKALVSRMLSYQKNVNALLGLLHTEVGPEWRGMGDRRLQAYIDEIEKQRGLDFSGVDIQDLREGTVKDVDYLEALNILGWRDIAKAVTAKSPEELAAVNETSSVEDQMALLSHLKQQSLDMRGLDFWGGTANIAVQSAPYIAEFMLTGGLATVGKLPLRVAVQQALKKGGVQGFRGIATAAFRPEGRKALAEAAEAVLIGEAKKTPVMLPKDLASAYNEWQEGPVVVPGADGMKLAVPERKVEELVNLAIQHVIRDYTGRVSEYAGEAIPDSHLLYRMLPKKARARLGQMILDDVFSTDDVAKTGLVRSFLFDNAPISGPLVEVLEEKWNAAIDYGVTKFAEATDIEAMNLGQQEVIGSWRENLQEFVSIAFSTNALGIARLSSQVRNVRNIARIVDNHRQMVDAAEQVPLEQRSVVQSKEFYDAVRGGDQQFFLDTEDARTFFQSDPEMAESCGITEESINAAESKGLMVAVSQNRMIAEQAKSPAMREAGERLLAMVRQSGVTVNQALKSDVGEEVVQAYKEQQERIARYRNKFAAVFSAAEAAGVSEAANKANADLVGRILNHLATGMNSGEMVEAALDGLLTKMEEDPENFASAARPVYLTEVTEDVIATLERVAEEAPAEEASAPVAEEAPAEEASGAYEFKNLTDENIEQYTKMVNSLVGKWARDYKSIAPDEGELTSLAYIAVDKALSKYQEGKGASFATYASRAIENAFREYAKRRQRLLKLEGTSLNAEVGTDGAEAQDFIANESAEAPGSGLDTDTDLSNAERAARAIVEAMSNSPAQKIALRYLIEGKNQLAAAQDSGVSKQAISGAVSRLRESLGKVAAKYDAPMLDVMKALIDIYKTDPDTLMQEDMMPAPSESAVEMDAVFKQFDGTKAFHRAPNGKSSNLTVRQWLQVRTQAFKNWFGDWESAALLNNAQRAWDDNNYTFTYRFAPSAHLKEKLEAILGHEIRILQIDGSTVRHIRNRHGGSAEAQKGQRQQAAEDVVTLPYLLNTCDYAERAPEYDDRKGNRAVMVSKRINGVAVVGTIERGSSGAYCVTKWEIVSAAPMSRAPGLNALSDADIQKIQRDLEKIKSDAKNSSKIVDANGEPRVVYHGTRVAFNAAFSSLIESTLQRVREVIPAYEAYKKRKAEYDASMTLYLKAKRAWETAKSEKEKGADISEQELEALFSAIPKERPSFPAGMFSPPSTWSAARQVSLSYRRGEKAAVDFVKKYGVPTRIGYDGVEDTVSLDDKAWLEAFVAAAKDPYFNAGDAPVSFNRDRISTDEGFFGGGYYFAFDRDVAKGYAQGGTVYEVFLNIRNPAIEKESHVLVRGSTYVDPASTHTYEGHEDPIPQSEVNRWLQENGHDGVIIPEESSKEASEGGEVLVLEGRESAIKSATDNVGTFDPANPDIRYQNEGVIRGATSFGDYFNTNYRAIITLFKGNANASTLVHESAHWLKGLMNALCEMKDAAGNYIASDSLREEYQSIEKWLDRQKYTAEKGTREYLIEREEKFARAFEYYVMKGGTPPVQVTSAFATLRGYLVKIYKELRNMPEFFGFEFSDDIRETFDRMIATDTLLDRESPLREASDFLRKTFAGLLGLSADETNDIQRILKLADSQMAAELDRHQTNLLPQFRKQWRVEARETIKSMPVYGVWEAARKTEETDGRLDADTLLAEEGVTEEMVKLLRARGLVKQNGADPAALLSKFGYDSLQEMVNDLAVAQSPAEFEKEYLKKQEALFRQNLTLDEKTLSVSAVRELLDKLSELLAIRGGRQGYSIRKGEAERQALLTLGEMKVKDVESDKTHLAALKERTSIMTKAVSQKDYVAALEQIDAIRKLYAVLKEKADAKKRVTKVREKLRRAVKAKRGKIYGDYHDALKELAYYFGFSAREPEPVKAMEPNYRQRVMDSEMNDEQSDAFLWPAFLLSNEMRDYSEMTWADFEQLANCVDNLYGKGRELVEDAKGSFGAKLKARRAAIVNSLSRFAPKYNRRKESSGDKIASAGRGLLHIGSNLRVLLGRADGYEHMGESGESGPCLALRDLLVPAVSEAVGLESRTLAALKTPLEALWNARERITLPADFQFAGKGLTYGYSKWTPEMVIAACLNLGNATNRDRLVRGYGWEDKDLNDLASCIPADLWPHIQAIWDILSGDLQAAASRTFFEENYYKMRLVQPDGMGVHYEGGKTISFVGGYYPIRYTHRAKSKSHPIPESHSRGLYAEVSSTMLRQGEIKNPDPLDLSIKGLLKHVHETAFYAATRMPCREVLSTFRSEEVEHAFGTTQSFEAYDMALNLLRNIANPDALTEGRGGDGGYMDMVERWSKSVMTSGALMLNLSSILKQPASLTVGAQETGEYFLDAMAAFSKNPAALAGRVKEMSAMMRDRINYMDPDLRNAVTRFGMSSSERVSDTMTRFGYAAMRFMDGAVAVPVWYAKYLQVTDRLNKEDADPQAVHRQAVGEADDFVARTQGAGRTLDLTAIQLDRVGRLLTPFMTAANAQFNTTIETLGAVRAGVLTSGEALMAIGLNIAAPAVYSAGIVALLNGILSDDEDDINRALKASLVELLSSPFSGYPLVRDVGQYVLGEVVDRAVGGKKGFRPTMFDVSAFEAGSRIFKGVVSAGDAALDGNWARAAWKSADTIGSAFKVPAIRIYERAVRQYKRSGGELPELLDKLEKATGKQPNKKEK